MPVFEWKARNNRGVIQRGTMNAKTQADVNAALRKQGLVPVSIKEKTQKSIWNMELGGTGVPSKDISIFTRQFATMIGAGLPLMQALKIMEEQVENKNLRKILKQIIVDVEGGSTLADAMSKHKGAFSNLYVNLVAAGEKGGALEEVLTRLAEYLEKAEALKRKIKGAMIYPVVVVVVAVSAVAILLIKVIPIFAQMFSAFGGDLPGPTKFVLELSDFLQANGLYILMAIIAIVVSINLIKKFSDQGRYVLDAIALKLPVFGDLLQKQSIARFTRTLGTLTHGGVSIIDGLEVTAKTAGNAVVEKAILDARSNIESGESISTPLKESGVFPPMVVQMIHIGEQTGKLEEMLFKIADFYDDEVDTAVEALTSALEPIIIVFLGGAIGGIVVAMYLPMFKIITLIH